jgi:hypothetical protein
LVADCAALVIAQATGDVTSALRLGLELATAVLGAARVAELAAAKRG